MASFLDQIPKQLAARRKAFAAVQTNPALLASCWTILRQIANNAYDYMRNATVGGCSFPDRPIYLTPEDASFINFGTAPAILMQDYAWVAAEKNGTPPPAEKVTSLPSDLQKAWSEQLAKAVVSFGRNHVSTRVYNLEPWLQEMYRDCLDVDFAEELQRQIDHLNEYMHSVPKALNATGLTGQLSKSVMDMFNLFKTITGSSHQLEHDKMSFTDKRNFVNTAQQIEETLQKADVALGAAAAGRSAVRELFGFWKEANYQMMKYTRLLRALWAGTSLDDRIADLAWLLTAVQNTLNRCSDQDPIPQPQLPILRSDDDSPHLSREEIVSAFHAIMMQDIVLGSETALSRNETRRFGPLSVVIAPGRGVPRYCVEIRRFGALAPEEEAKPKQKNASLEDREMEVDRRIRYPMNVIVVPTRADAGPLLENMADAWLEFNQAAYPTNYKNILEEARNIVPNAFQPAEGVEAKDVSPFFARQALAKLLAAFVRWSKDDTEPNSEKNPDFAPFKEWALTKIGIPKIIMPLRYRPMLEVFAESGEKRRAHIWRRFLGPRYMLDRQLVAINILPKDWTAFKENLKYLSRGLISGNTNIANALVKMRDKSDPMAEHKALALLRRFMYDDPDLKTALLTTESQISIEMETLRTQAESLGRSFQYDQVSLAMMRRQASQIQEKRNIANTHIDQNLIGLMYALEGNGEAAIVALSMCLTPLDKRQTDDVPQPETPPAIDNDWFAANLPPLDSPFEKKTVPGQDSLGTVCYDYVYYNLGQVYMQMRRYVEAGMCFRGYLESADPAREHMVREWAEQLSAEVRSKLSDKPAEAGGDQR